jgi:hypothetical protein
MKISRRILWSLVCLSILFVPACKKEKQNTTENELVFALDKTEIYHYSTLIAESIGKSIFAFDKKIFINGKEYPAELVEDKYIAFVVFPDVAVGKAHLSFTVDGEKHELEFEVLPLPDVTNPDLTLVNYKNDLENLYKESLTALDSVNKRMGLQPDAIYTSLKEDVQKINDSIEIAISRFNNLDPDAKLVAARIFEANRLSLNSSFDNIHEINQIFIKNKLSGRDVTLCLDDFYNTSEKFQCIFNSLRRSLLRVIRECIFNGMRAGIISAGIGVTVTIVTANPVAGWKAGSAAAFPLLAAFSAKSLLSYLTQMVSVYNTSVEVSENEISNYRLAPGTFYNDEDLPVKFSIKRRNIKASDKTSNYKFISDLVITLEEFNSIVEKYFKSSISKTPTFSAPALKSEAVEDLKFISVSVKDNNAVKLKSISGTIEKPLIRFTSESIEDQNFIYVVNYNDGVFQSSEEFSAVLKTQIGFSLNDTTISGNSSIIKFKVNCPENMDWNITYPNSWMIILQSSGKGKNENCEVAIQQNNTGAIRSDYITFTAGNYTKSVKITQNVYSKIIYKSFEKTLSSIYQEGNRSKSIGNLDSFKYKYIPGSGEPNLNFQLYFLSAGSFNKYAPPISPYLDSIRDGYVLLEIRSTDGSKIFPYIDINNKSLNNNDCGLIKGYNTFTYSYFNNTNEVIDSKLFKNTDSTLNANYTVSIAEKIVQWRKWTKGTWCDLAPYPAPRHLPYGQNNLYLPFRIQSGSGYHYGWIRISTIDESKYTIHDLAFQSIPNTAIKTGEK